MIARWSWRATSGRTARAVAAGLLGPILVPAVASALSGCGATGTVEPAAPSARSTATRQMFEQMLNTDNGLLVRRWVVTDSTAQIGAALMRYGDGAALSEAATLRLRRDGLRLVRIRAEQVDGLLAELGLTPLDVSGWHGQVVEWRELLAQPIPAEGEVVAVAGRVRTLEQGMLRLVARAWTVPMEDGPSLYLELVPELIAPRRLSIQDILGTPERPPEVLADLMVRTRLQPGSALVLTGEAPSAEWLAPPADAEPGGTSRDQQDGDDESEPARSDFGPETTAPDTLGEFLFRNPGEPPLRTLLVFVPRLPGGADLSAAPGSPDLAGTR